MDAAHITRLPTETIQLIGSVCHPSDLVALSRTCRRLHGICNGEAPLRACVFKHLGLPTSDYVTSKEDFQKLMVDEAPVPEAWRVNKLALARNEDSDEDDENNETASDHHLRRVGSTDTWEPWVTPSVLWARLAAAALTLPSRVDHLETLLSPDPDDPDGNPLITHLDEWIPSLHETLKILSTLVVFAYPTVIDARTLAALATLAKHLFDPGYWRDHIQPSESWNPVRARLREVARELAFCVAVGTIGNGTVDLTDLTTHLFRAEYGQYSAGYMGCHDFDILLAASVAWIVQQDAKGHDNLPRLPRLPFLINVLNGEIGVTDMIMDLPHPGQAFPRRYNYYPAWEGWHEDNARRMFVDHADSEWIGYYTSRSENAAGWECQHIWGIRFVEREEWRSEFYRGDPWVIKSSGGSEISGPFLLEGEYKSDEAHEVELEKANQPPSPNNWSMNGSFTPLGIVGRWTEGPWNSPTGEGFIWIYKREWVEKGEVLFADKPS